MTRPGRHRQVGRVSALAVLFLLSAVPAEGSSWAWTLEDRQQLEASPAARRLFGIPPPAPAKARLTVKGVDETTVTRLGVVLEEGVPSLAGRPLVFERNYGGAELEAGIDITPLERNRLRPVQAALGELFDVDPLVEATKQGPRCSAETRAALAAAAGHWLLRRVRLRPEDARVEGSADCAPRDGWTLKLTVHFPVRDADASMTWTGSVRVPPAAWRAELHLTSQVKLSVQQPAPLRLEGTMTLHAEVRPLETTPSRRKHRR